MFEVTVNTRRAVVGTKELITTSSAGIQVQFTFSEDWDSLSKIAIFRNGDDANLIPVAVPNSNLVTIPAQSCSEDFVDEPLFVGVYGTDGLGAVIIPTIWTSLGVLRPGAVTTDIITPPEPTPDMWAQILAIANEAAAIADECETNEELRVAAEQLRAGAETARANAEALRAAAEDTRAENENQRQVADTQRQAAEDARAQAEALRIQAEELRQTNETSRASAESDRASAEQERVAAEQYREEKYAEYVETVSGYADNASASATAAAGSASNAANSATAAAGSASAAATSAQNASDSASQATSSATAAQAAQSAAEDAQDAAETAADEAKTAVTHYPKIVDGYWYVWNAETETWVNTEIRAEGRAGYSPEVTITEIEGGHRVTITDEDHPQGQTFDVMDGQGGGGSGGTSDYSDLTNKPQINGHTLTGNQTASQLGLATPSDIPTVPVQSVNGKTGAVVLSAADVGAKPDSYTAPVSSVNNKTGAVTLGAGDIGFSDSATYQAGSVGAELQEQNRQLSDLDDDKQDAPSTAGTPGQVLGLDSNLDPVWVNNGGGSGGAVDDVQINGTSIVSGGVANIPVGDNTNQGVTRGRTDRGISLASGWAQIVPATSNAIKSSNSSYLPVVPSNQHEAAFYGLAKAAGDTTQSASSNPVGTYTDEAKAAIKSMLGVTGGGGGVGGGGMIIVNLSGTQITQAGADNTFYVCGELTELTFTAPSVGITMIRFTSGTTPTVLTVNGVTSWMFDNDPTAASLEANKTYDINVLNGVGVVGWA